MNADKQLELLGYRLKETPHWGLVYVKDITLKLCFDNEDKTVSKYDDWNNGFEYIPITFEELKIINKKIEELGW